MRRRRQKKRKTRKRRRRRKQRKRRTKRRRRKRGGAPYKDFVVGEPVKLSTAGVMRVLEGNFHHNSPYMGNPRLARFFNDPASWRGIITSSTDHPLRRLRSSSAGTVVVSWRFPVHQSGLLFTSTIWYEDSPGPRPWGGAYGWARDGVAGPVSDIEPLGRAHSQIPG